MIDLTGSVALVTGAGVRLGQAIAIKLSQLGMRVIIHYHHSEKGAKQTAKPVSYTHLTLPTNREV